MARSGSRWLFVASLERRVAQRFFCLRCQSHATFHDSRAKCSDVVPYTNCGLHTADVAATGILLVQKCSRPRPRLTTDCPTFRTGTAATTPGCRDCHGCNRDDDRRNSARNCSIGSGSVFTSTQSLIRRRRELESHMGYGWCDCMLVIVTCVC